MWRDAGKHRHRYGPYVKTPGHQGVVYRTNKQYAQPSIANTQVVSHDTIRHACHVKCTNAVQIVYDLIFKTW